MATLRLLRLKVPKKPAAKPTSRRVVSPRDGLDLDHVGAEIGKHQARARTHDGVAEFEHANAGKG